MIHFRYIAVIILVIGFFLIREGCNKVTCPEIVSRTETKDTVIVVSDKVDSSAPAAPTLVKSTKPQPVRVDSFIVFEKADTAAILANCAMQNSYSETYRLPQGRVRVDNTTQNNEITSQRVFLDSVQQMVITNTITNTVAEKKKNTVWFGASGGYRTDTTVTIGVSLMLINKKRTGFEIDAKIDNRGKVTGEVGIKIKL